MYFVRTLCRRAHGVAYVTEHALQKKFPCRRGSVSANYSTIDSVSVSKVFSGRKPNRNLLQFVTVAQLDRPFKRVDLLVDAFENIVAHQNNIKLTIVGGGDLQPSLEREVRSRGLEKFINFTGRISNSEVFGIMQAHDFYVSASVKEGLPRGVIEAMHCGLVCAATSVGGTSELLDPEFLIDPGCRLSVEKAISKLCQMSSDEYLIHSKRNFQKSLDFDRDLLARRRRNFYSKLMS